MRPLFGSGRERRCHSSGPASGSLAASWPQAGDSTGAPCWRPLLGRAFLSVESKIENTFPFGHKKRMKIPFRRTHTSDEDRHGGPDDPVIRRPTDARHQPHSLVPSPWRCDQPPRAAPVRRGSNPGRCLGMGHGYIFAHRM